MGLEGVEPILSLSADWLAAPMGEEPSDSIVSVAGPPCLIDVCDTVYLCYLLSAYQAVMKSIPYPDGLLSFTLIYEYVKTFTLHINLMHVKLYICYLNIRAPRF